MFNKTLISALMCSSVSLGGCAELAATAIEDARSLHESAKGYIGDVHHARREIRRICWEMLVKEVEALEADGKYAEARELLKLNYPGLVSISTVKNALDENKVVGEEPFGCDGLSEQSTIVSVPE